MSEREPRYHENVRIGHLELDPPLVLAPLAGFTIPPFRSLCARLGAELTFTEMVSANGLVYSNRRTFPLLDQAPDEGPLGVQLFGSEQEMLVQATRMVADQGFNLIDFNMGCPVPKVTRSGAGSALLRTPDKALSLLAAMVEASPLPVTVKVRLGWESEEISTLLARLGEVGVAAVTVHGRTRAQGYSGRADWEAIGRCRERLAGGIPLFGSGDLFTSEQVVRVLASGQCDGVQLARGALGNPWLFREVCQRLRGEEPTQVQGDEILSAARAILAWQVERGGEVAGIQAFRSFCSKLLKGREGARECRRLIYATTDLEQVDAILVQALADS